MCVWKCSWFLHIDLVSWNVAKFKGFFLVYSLGFSIWLITSLANKATFMTFFLVLILLFIFHVSLHWPEPPVHSNRRGKSRNRNPFLCFHFGEEVIQAFPISYNVCCRRIKPVLTVLAAWESKFLPLSEGGPFQRPPWVLNDFLVAKLIASQMPTGPGRGRTTQASVWCLFWATCSQRSKHPCTQCPRLS